MGYRIHVIKKKEQFSNYTDFNHDNSEFDELLCLLNVEKGFVTQNADSARFEVKRKEIERAHRVLTAIANGKTPGKKYDVDSINEVIEKLCRTPQQMADTFKTILSEADPEGEEIILEWF